MGKVRRHFSVKAFVPLQPTFATGLFFSEILHEIQYFDLLLAHHISMAPPSGY